MKRLIVGALVASVLSIAPAAASGFYVSGAFGPNQDRESGLPFVSEDSGLTGSVAIGAKVNGVEGLRVELEAGFITHDVSIGPLPLAHDTTAVMVNVLYDVDRLAAGKLTPYLMVGAGVAHTELTLGGIAPLTLENDGFAYQAGVGFNYQVSDNVALGLGYRHLEAPPIEIFGFELDGGSNDAVVARATFSFE